MDEKQTALLADVTDEWLFAWTDPKMVGRAYGYLDKVEGITLVDGQGIVALAHGTDDYYTRVFIDDDGALDAVCSCPVGHRCKHAVAVILNVSKKIKDGGSIAEDTTDCAIWKAAESALAAAKAKIEERERKILEQRLAKEREEEEFRQRIERRRNKVLATFGTFSERARDCQSRGDYDGVLKVLDEACRNTDDDFDIEPYGGELYGMIEEMSKVAIEALRCCKMSDSEKILFAHDVETPYRYYVSPRFLYDEYWKEESATKFSVDVWHEVGDALKARLEDDAFVDGCGYHALCHTVYGGCEAYWRAGRGEDAFTLRKRFAAKTDSWCDCANDLCRLGRRDEAKSFLLEAREFVRGPESEEWSDGGILINKLAEVYEGEGNFAYATALLAENWLERVGGIDHCSDRYALVHLLNMAEKAGCRREVFVAIIYAVDTQIPPAGMPYNDSPRLIQHQPLPPPPFVPKEAPPWPLPPTGLDLGIPKPLFPLIGHWWEAEAVLIRVAIHEGMLEDAARHFVALPSRPGGYFRVSHVDQLTDFEREVREALFEKFPEVAQKIAAMQECRSWGTKHPGEKLPTDMKERLFPILYNSSWRSGHRVVGRGPGGGRKVNFKR